MNEKELINAIKEGNTQAFEVLYKQYWQVLFHHCYLMLKDKDETQDIVQEVFTSLWKNKDTIEFSGSLSGYLYRATRNKVLNKIKKDSVIAKYMNEKYLDKEVMRFIPDNILIEKELSRQIERCIEALPNRTREIFLLSREKGLSHKEIAEMLGLSTPTVKKQISNALAAIRAHVKFVLLLF